jgi:hypothetical protein
MKGPYNKSYLTLFPDISDNDSQILSRMTVIFPEIANIAVLYEGDFEGLISLLRSNSIYRRHVTVVKSQLTEETKLPDWFINTVSHTDVKNINKKFEALSFSFKRISDTTESANAAYNDIIVEAQDHADKIKVIYEDTSIFIIRLQSNDLMGVDNAEFSLSEASEYKKLDILIKAKVLDVVPVLKESIDFAELSVEARSGIRKRIRKKLMDKYREDYYKKVVVAGDEVLTKHIELVKQLAMEDLIVLKKLRK